MTEISVGALLLCGMEFRDRAYVCSGGGATARCAAVLAAM